MLCAWLLKSLLKGISDPLSKTIDHETEHAFPPPSSPQILTIANMSHPQVEETSREREERLKGWQEFLGDPDQERPKKPPDANSSESGPQRAERDPPSQDNGAAEGDAKAEATEGGDAHKGASEDVTASTDSSVAGSDEEAET